MKIRRDTEKRLVGRMIIIIIEDDEACNAPIPIYVYKQSHKMQHGGSKKPHTIIPLDICIQLDLGEYTI